MTMERSRFQSALDDRSPGGSSILVVEDESAHAELMRRAFEDVDEDYELVVVESVSAAREQLARRSFSLVVSDLMLPDGRGIELLPEYESGREFPVILMTSHGDEKIAVEAMKAGALDYVVKTETTLATMPHIVGRALREWRQREELRRTESALRRMSRIFEVADPIVIEDLDGRIVDVNEEAERFFGWSRLELLGRDGRTLVPEVERERLEGYWAAALVGREVRNVESVRRVRGGGEVPVLMTLSTLQDHRGVTTGIAAITRDISALKQLEEEARQAQKLEAIGRLSSGIAHDFNNLLMGVMGCADIALSRLGDDESAARPYLEEIRESTRRGSTLASQLLDFSRRRQVVHEELDLGAMVYEARQMLARLVGDDVHLRVDIPEAPVPISGARGAIDQVVMNLVVNARDAMPEGGSIELRVSRDQIAAGDLRLGEHLTPGPYAVFEVRDTGVGMSEEVQSRIFEPFFTTKGVGEGTGLGLSTVYGIVSGHGGHLLCESVEGRGTTFTVMLPLGDGDIRERTPDDMPRTGASRRSERVLVVEDESLVRMTVRHYLEARGHPVLEAGDGEQARALQDERGPFDLVVTDMVMPGMAGPRVVAALREVDPSLAALYMSAHPTAELREDWGLDEEDATLQKPFTSEELYAGVDAALGAREATDAVPVDRGVEREASMLPGEPTLGSACAGDAREPSRHILLIEDYDVAREVSTQLLEEFGYRVTGVGTGREAREEFGGDVDLVITDIGLPDVDGVVLLRELRERAGVAVPAIFISGGAREGGVSGEHSVFLRKPIEFDELAARIEELLAGG